jgi:hypothetical protein
VVVASQARVAAEHGLASVTSNRSSKVLPAESVNEILAGRSTEAYPTEV